MIMQSLPPVGRPLRIGPPSPASQVEGYRSVWLNSGTSALSLALILAKRCRADVTAPQVILPAYGCPDLVAAAVYAGVQPLLVDINASDPSYCLEQLEQALSERVVAVVMVNFLGIRERVGELKSMVKRCSQALLIEDNAQWYPEFEDESLGWQGDMALTSFGRGKPVNLMGGGVLWVAEHLRVPLEAWVHEHGYAAPKSLPSSQAFRFKAGVFNTLLKPAVYHWVSRLPFLHVGATTYHTLEAIEPMDGARFGQVNSGVLRYLQLGREIEKIFADALATTSVRDLPTQLSVRTGRLLRYPVLLPDTVSENTLAELGSLCSLGVSRMYQRPLPHIEGVSPLVQVYSTISGAQQFAQRLLTLPVHAGVTERHVANIAKQLNTV